MNKNLPQQKEWNKRISVMGGGILQSYEWAKFQQALGREVVWSEGDNWAFLATVRRSNGLVYLICSYGPIAKDRTSAIEGLHHLVQKGRELGVDFVRAEPQHHLKPEDIARYGGRKISEFQAEHTLVLDLTRTEEELRHELASGHRNLINGTERRGIKIRTVDARSNLDLFESMLTDTAKRAGVSFFDRAYYQTLINSNPDMVKLYLAEVEGRPVASALVYDWNDTRYYAHAGAFQDLNRQAKASVSLVWQIVIDAKQQGFKRFDLWGVSPSIDAANHKLAGVSRFKRAFGGEQIDYLGTWDIPLRQIKYRLYSIYRRLRGLD